LPGDIRIGISGWTYAPWRGTFYPKKLPQARELHYASRVLNSIEINGTFYALQKPESFARWADDTPDDFVFAVKAPRFITHIRRLKEVKTPVANFLASGLLRLGAKLGPILWQLPPSFRFDAARMGEFLALLPHDTKDALRLARQHDSHRRGRVWIETDAERPLRHALEIRHESFVDPAFIALLRRYHVALVCADSVTWPLLMDVAADFIYCRLHGSEELYASGYDDDALDAWAERVLAWAKGGEPKDATRVIARPAPKRRARDVFVYFDNDAKVRAPVDAQALAARIAARRGKS
jgi:uncharacterized protein YecE (DUF72 family)